jgi:glutathione S-transferase
LNRARAKQFVEVFLSKINPIYYAAVIRGEPNLGPALVQAIKTYIVPILPSTTFIIGEKFGLAEILVSPFILRLYLLAKLGLLGEGTEAKLDEIKSWSKYVSAVLANESLKSTFVWESEARKAIDRIRKVREANKLAATTLATQANGTKV